MRKYQIIPLILVGVLAAGGGGVAGYTIGSGTAAPLEEALILSNYRLAAAGYSTSPSALQIGQPQVSENSLELYDYNSLPRYKLGTDHGFVAVFYAESHALKERTKTPASALSPEEHERLTNGIYIYTEEQLVRALQDYGS